MDPEYQIFLNTYLKCNAVMGRVASVNIHPLTGLLAGFTLNGFSKSGTAYVEYHKVGDAQARVYITTRYGEKDMHFLWPGMPEDDLFMGIVLIALRWWDSYRDGGYPIPSEWVDNFLAFGLVKKVEKVEYRIVG